jgi:hypothetical protein
MDKQIIWISILYIYIYIYIYIHNICLSIAKYCSAIKINEVSIHATTWMDLGIILLKERSQAKKGTYCTIPLYIKFKGNFCPFSDFKLFGGFQEPKSCVKSYHSNSTCSKVIGNLTIILSVFIYIIYLAIDSIRRVSIMCSI